MAANGATQTATLPITGKQGDAFDPKSGDFQLPKPPDSPPTPAEGSALALVQSDLTQLGIELTGAGDPTVDSTTNHTWYDYVQKTFATPSTSDASDASTTPSKNQTDPTTGLPLDQTGNLAAFQAQLDSIQDKLDSLNSLTDIDQMKVQSMMDERSKMLETLSNMLKSDADLSKTLRDNLK
jgi:hypothetical protein